MSLHELKNIPTGTYILVIRLQKRKRISIGRLGMFSFRKGYYLYVGSAFGPGGLNARISRHLRQNKKRHWHIDYLTLENTIIDVWFKNHRIRHECEWAKSLEEIPALKRPVSGFGSSDCTCRSHLFFSAEKPSMTYYRNFFGGDLERWNL